MNNTSSDEPYTVTRVGVGVIIANGGKILLGLRHGSHAAGVWACPGGKVELGVSPQQTAIDETKEETGINLDKVQKLDFWTNDYFYDDQGNLSRHFITVYAYGESKGQRPKVLEPNKCLEWHWFSFDELKNGMVQLMEGFDQLLTRYDSLEQLQDELNPQPKTFWQRVFNR